MKSLYDNLIVVTLDGTRETAAYMGRIIEDKPDNDYVKVWYGKEETEYTLQRSSLDAYIDSGLVVLY